MSNRTEAQVSAQAELRLSHIAQIEALTKPGLTDEQRVRVFAAAAEFDEIDLIDSLNFLKGETPASAVWFNGHAEKSLFASLPGCQCPVIERLQGVPEQIPDDWHPSSEMLERFSQIQIERRFP